MFRLEYAQNNDIIINNDIFHSSINKYHDAKQKNHSLEATNDEDSLLYYHCNNASIMNTNDHLLSTKEEKEALPAEIIFSNENDNSTVEKSTNTPEITNENDILNTGFSLNRTVSLTNSSAFSSEPCPLPNDLRSRIDLSVQQTDESKIIHSTPTFQEIKPQKCFEQHKNKNNISISYVYIIIFLVLPFILGHIVTRWDQSMITKVVEELVKTNQRFNNVKDMRMGNVEEALTKQLEEKLQHMIYQQSAWHDREKYAFGLQIYELQEILKRTQQSLTNTIHQLTQENEQLQEKIKLLEHRLQVTQEQYPKNTIICIEGVNCTKSTLNKLVTIIFKQTESIAADASVHLSSIFEYLSASVSNIVDHRHKYIEKSKRKLANFASSSTVKKIRTSLRRSIENLSSSFHKVKVYYVTWFKTRRQRREQNRILNSEKETPQRQIHKKYSWHWTLQQGFNRKPVRHQTSNKEKNCYSKFYFPMDKICLMKNWLIKFLRLLSRGFLSFTRSILKFVL
ncbi:unnamed protein product [Rotaria sp. Silwood1]|nr:unnamed protein product [Rotaria sp. Silwood1]CAF1028988.1 unnamed protein product [Rotaria sp. Silwood1]CAF3389814.1 unnamed protein product [Rotaria sp. Silwood1]CAF3423656.1 unnamed protein product [Rotaria sp. Silwood1]CAF4679906.1 unnamed protein product [Rotaria sp. Silwood1]